MGMTDPREHADEAWSEIVTIRTFNLLTSPSIGGHMTYAHAFWEGHAAALAWGIFLPLARPFWRGRRYLTAWDHGADRGAADLRRARRPW